MFRISSSKVYSGTLLLEPLANFTGFSIDLINFIASHFIALFLAFVYRQLCFCVNLSLNTKHVILFVPGFILTFLSFGYQSNHLLVLLMLSYISIRTCSPSCVHIAVLVIAIMHLSYLHLMRQLEDYGAYTLDITGPMMIMVQKVTSLALCIHDGFVNPNSLNPEQKKYAVRKLPTLLEFFSYNLAFLNITCGPLVYYNDFIEFVKEEHFLKHSEKMSKKKLISSSLPFIFKNLSICMFFAIMYLIWMNKFAIEQIEDEKFLQSSSVFSLMVFLYLATLGARFKYYHAWKFGEAICNTAGLGFNDFDSNSRPKWDLLNPVDIFRFEFALNFKEALDAWNKTTQTWLRRTAYERAKKYRTLTTYVLSAIWHGFYPGYYLTFISGALFTQAARIVRRKIKPKFQSNSYLSHIYDIFTFLFTIVMMTYVTFPFVLLNFKSSLRIYKKLYFFGHIFALFGFWIVPFIFPSNDSRHKTKSKTY